MVQRSMRLSVDHVRRGTSLPMVPRVDERCTVHETCTFRREQPNNKRPRRSSTEVTLENSNTSAAQPASHAQNIVHVPSELNIISSDSNNSVREQLRQVNQRLDEVQRKFVKSKKEVDKSSKGGSPFVTEIQDKPVLANF
ncbi:hypothetical protein BHE74_00028992 [Ensete ventricosum]|nr:hypothetical protein GW17_00049419 [Ensete ventricosum]RWW63808.1 hypothetical protein BHE74_00028992 [Ensete ventricosum]